MSKIKAPYGLWESSICSSTLTRSTVALAQVRVDSQDTYWVEERPEQEGRNALLRRRPTGQIGEFLPLTPENELLDVRTRVHEYGGKAYGVQNGVIVVTNAKNGRVYKYDVNNVTKGLIPLTPICDLRFGDFELNLHKNVVYAVCENHEDPENIRNYLVSIPLDGSASRDKEKIATVFEGTDFVNSPTINSDGDYIAWVSWNHPNMPWDYSKLHIARVDDFGNLYDQKVLFDTENVSVTQPRWTIHNDLIHVNDSSGFANIYRTEGFNTDYNNLRTRHLNPSDKIFTQPAWALGLHTYDIFDENHIVATWYHDGIAHLGTMRIDNGELEEWHIPYQPLGNVACSDGRVIALVNSPTISPCIIQIRNQNLELLRTSFKEELDVEDISIAKHISWETSESDTAYGFLYLPTSKNYESDSSEKPPLIVEVHGGPTSQANSGMKINKQYWTNRGFALLDVNYRGSTAYGRKYQDKLKGKWGVYDIDDCVTGVKYLINEGLVDPNRIAIHGWSAGGYTTLAALAFTDVFTAGASHFGVSDLKLLAAHTHKFESQYLFGLLGSNNTKDKVWTDRSPMFYIQDISAPLLLLQGDADMIVPLEQAENMYTEMKQNGQEVELKVYQNEGHGFRQDKNIKDSIERELDFYIRTWQIR
ncbi:S9 family peptidase [Actinomyces sp. zg-332]|uniref:alpha/beta hydrolase family protein n=1 Tax=Actinomyces sp. zg-332 TaxID=2708340 RepID=UPI001421D8FE|nr:S9 family peptidase [Actinomyces sp. zg-332]QPK93645.1 S9 family peptidase [Actinomyces sp. zg-332]